MDRVTLSPNSWNSIPTATELDLVSTHICAWYSGVLFVLIASGFTKRAIHARVCVLSVCKIMRGWILSRPSVPRYALSLYACTPLPYWSEIILPWTKEAGTTLSAQTFGFIEWKPTWPVRVRPAQTSAHEQNYHNIALAESSQSITSGWNLYE